MNGQQFVHLPIAGAVTPGRGWRYARRATQSLALVAIVGAPLLGGWQRLERNRMGAWHGHGWDLPPAVMDALPTGSASERAYDSLQLVGGGMGVEYFGIPMLDPVAGALVASAASFSATMALAWALPVLLGIIAGRAFCGWFCPFGTIARALDGLLRRLPWRPRAFTVPRSRPIRWVLLVAGIAAGVLGIEGLLYFVLPHAMIQQAAYSLWLMGGIGASAGWLLGLLAAGIVLGPTTYCATLCPTGAALSLLGRRRPVRLTIAEAPRCGTHCSLCSKACWLSLDPAHGDPGPDCDACARCVDVCPRTNLRVGLSRRVLARVASSAAIIMLTIVPTEARADDLRDLRGEHDQHYKPVLLIESRVRRGSTDTFLSVLDLSGVRLDADDPRRIGGVRLSLVMARGAAPDVDEAGRSSFRETYAGPVTLDFRHQEGESIGRLRFDGPTAPRSTPRRSIYRRDLALTLRAGDVIELAPIEGWTDEPLVWSIPPRNPGGSASRFGVATAVSFLLFAGLMSIALALPGGYFRTPRRAASSS